jgi:hypothetical protein
MSLWQLAACIDGHNEAHSSDETPADPMGFDDFEAMLERNAEWMATVH